MKNIKNNLGVFHKKNINNQSTEPFVYVNCNLCGGDDTAKIGTEKGWNICRCKRCGFIYVNPRPFIQEGYTDFFEEDVSDPETQWGAKSHLSFKSGLDRLEKMCPNKGRILDIGCGYGFLLDMAQKRGWQIFGVDTSKIAIQYCKDKLDIEVFHGTVEDAAFPSDFFSAVVMWLCLEHLPDPKNTLKEIYRILSPNSMLIVRVPNVKFLLLKSKVMGTNSIIEGAPHHLSGFISKTLFLMLKTAGFKEVEVRPANINKMVLEGKLGVIGAKLIGSLANSFLEIAYSLDHFWEISPSIMGFGKKC